MTPPTLMELLKNVMDVEFPKEALKVGFITPVYFDFIASDWIWHSWH